LDEAEHLALELGDARITSRMATARVMHDLQTGDLASARRRLDDVLQLGRVRGDHQLPAMLAMLASILHKQGLAEWSARVYGLAEIWPGAGQTNTLSVVLTQYFRVGDIRAELRASMGEAALLREMAAGERLTLEDVRAIPHPAAAVGAALTAREIEVLQLLAQELSNPQIAERLVVSRRTVDAHLRSIYDKLGVKSRDGAVRAAHTRGVLPT
jgi:ATP/maltotriose-dependent transcriptional regulator MalT